MPSKIDIIFRVGHPLSFGEGVGGRGRGGSGWGRWAGEVRYTLIYIFFRSIHMAISQ